MDLLPCIVQDARTGEVLTLAYMNDEALERTRETGEMWFWSRSRQELWHKGETSGNVQRAAARCATTATPTRCWRSSSRPAPPATPASAPASTTASSTPAPARGARRARAHDRRARAAPARGAATRRGCSPTARCVGAKVHEEAEEVARAAREESDERVAEEAADVLYHLAVLLAARGLEPGRRVRGAQWPSPLTPS